MNSGSWNLNQPGFHGSVHHLCSSGMMYFKACSGPVGVQTSVGFCFMQYHRFVDKHPVPTQWFKEVVIFLVGYLYPTTHTEVCSSGGSVTQQFIDL